MNRRKRLLEFLSRGKKNKEKSIVQGPSKDSRVSIYNYKFGQKNIKLFAEKVEVVKETAVFDTLATYHCAFCNKDFDSLLAACPECSRQLVKVKLRKCQFCGAKTKITEEACWVCNAAFPKVAENTEKELKWLLTLNINNNFYRNTDKELSSDMLKLFDDLIAVDFAKEPIDAWVKNHERAVGSKKELAKSRYESLDQEPRENYLVYVIGYTLLVITMLLLAVIFWVK